MVSILSVCNGEESISQALSEQKPFVEKCAGKPRGMWKGKV
jgi:hypothetical protein